MSRSKCAGIAGASGCRPAGKLPALFTPGLKSTVFLTFRLFVYYMHAPKTSIRVCCGVSSLESTSFWSGSIYHLKVIFTRSVFDINWECLSCSYTWKYMEDDRKGSLISVAFRTTSEALFSVLVAFRERNAVRTFCFLFAPSQIFSICSSVVSLRWSLCYW